MIHVISLHDLVYYISYRSCAHDLLESGPVSELELNATSDTTLLISWGEPVSPNGNILSYSITITDLRDDSNIRRENRGAEESTMEFYGDKFRYNYIGIHLKYAIKLLYSFRTWSGL